VRIIYEAAMRIKAAGVSELTAQQPPHRYRSLRL